jgi:hypothetical protein
MCLLALTKIAHDDSLDGGAAQATRGYVRPARSLFSNALNFCRSAVVALVRSPCRYCPFLSELHALRPVVFSADGDGGRKSPEHPAHVGILSTPTP